MKVAVVLKDWQQVGGDTSIFEDLVYHQEKERTAIGFWLTTKTGYSFIPWSSVVILHKED